jgi:L-alanine-DL-glutamate epimerase-like enolase superfamily enzyme
MIERRLSVFHETWPLREPFRISRGVKTDAQVVVVELDCNGVVGRGEAAPYPRYGETVEAVIDQITAVAAQIEEGIGFRELRKILPAGAARNAVDCALWDIRAHWRGVGVAETLGLPAPRPVETAVTIGLDTPENMARKAGALSGCPLLKIKLDREQITARLTAIRDQAPSARIIVDPNESWSIDTLRAHDAFLADMNIALLEQPLPADQDQGLAAFTPAVPVCADEACHTRADLAGLAGKYQFVNIKLDKTGGLSEALALKQQAEQMGFGIMIGCMVSTSLAMAPALLLAHDAAFVDLDGPLWMARDRRHALRIENGIIAPPTGALWGGANAG